MQVDGGEQPTLAAPPLLRSDGAFFNPLHGMPTALEVRVLGVLLLFRFETTRADELSPWRSGSPASTPRPSACRRVRRQVAPQEQRRLASEKVHPEGARRGAARRCHGELYGTGEIETAAAVIGNVSVSEIVSYVNRLNMDIKKSGKLYGPVRDNKGNKSPRQVAAIPAIAKLLSDERRPLRVAIAKHRLHAEAGSAMTKRSSSSSTWRLSGQS